MATYSVTIEGVERPLLLRSFEIRESINRVAVLNAEVVSDDASYRPSVDDEMAVTETDGSPVTTIFAGVIDEPEERGFVGPADDPIVTRINAVAFSSYADRRYVNETLAEGTLKSQLQTLVLYLAEYGVTLDGAQVDGPTMPAYEAAYRKLTDVLNDLSHISMGVETSPAQPYVWEIDYAKVLRMVQLGDDLAPANLIEGDGLEHGDLVISTTRRNYCNRLILRSSSGAMTTTAEDIGEQNDHGLWEMAIETPAELSAEVAERAAEGLLREFNFIQTEARFSTLTLGFRPAQTITITAARRNVNAAFVITEVVTRVLPDSNKLVREIAAVQGYRLGGSWMDILSRWGRGVGGVGIVGSGGGGTASGGSGVRGNGTTTVVDDVTTDADTIDQVLDLSATVTGSAVDEGDLTFRVTGPDPATTQVGLTRRVPVLAGINAGTLGQRLTRTLQALDLTQSWTMVLRTRVTGTLTAGQSQTVLLLGARDFSGPWVWIGRRYGDAGLVCEVADASPATRTAETPITPGLLPLALRYTATSPPALDFIAHGAVVESVSVELSDLGSPSLWEEQTLAGDEDGARPGVTVAQERTWQAALSLVEIAAEQRARQAVRTADLVSDSPLSESNDLADLAGGHDWTATSAFTTVGGYATSKWTLPANEAGAYIIAGNYLGSARYRPSVGYGDLTVSRALLFSGFGSAALKALKTDGTPVTLAAPPTTGTKGLVAFGDYIGANGSSGNTYAVMASDLSGFTELAAPEAGTANSIAKGSGLFYTLLGNSAAGGTCKLVSITSGGVASVVETLATGTQDGEAVRLIDTLAVTPDGTVAYLGKQTSGGMAGKIYKKIIGGAFSTFVSESSTWRLLDWCLACLSDGTLLAGWQRTGGSTGIIRHYATDGSTIADIDLSGRGTGTTPICLSLDDDEVGFWVVFYSNATTFSAVTLRHYRISDGVQLDTEFDPEDGTFAFDAPFCALRLPIA